MEAFHLAGTSWYLIFSLAKQHSLQDLSFLTKNLTGSLQWKPGILTTRPPGNSRSLIKKKNCDYPSLLTVFVIFSFFFFLFVMYFSEVDFSPKLKHTHTHTHAYMCVCSIQFCRSVVSDSLWPHELQHARPPCPSPTPGAYPNSCPLSRWCHPTCHSLLLMPSIFPSIRVFSNKSALRIRWPKFWSFSSNISPSNEHSRTDLL